MDNYFHLTLYRACDYLSLVGLKLNHVTKRDPRWQKTNARGWYQMMNLLMQEQPAKMTSQCQWLAFAWRHNTGLNKPSFATMAKWAIDVDYYWVRAFEAQNSV